MKVRNWLIGLYPRSWRERYQEEFEALLEECLHSPLDVLDIFLGALDAHLYLTYETNQTNWRLMNMNNKLRTAILLVFAAYIAFIVAGMSVYGFADDSPFIPMMATNTALYVSWTSIQVGSILALLSIAIGGLPILWALIRHVLRSSRKDLQLLLVPLYAFLAFVLYTACMIYLSFTTRLLSAPAPFMGHVLMWGEISIFVLGAILSTVAVWKVVSRTDVEQETLPLPGKPTIKLYEFAFGPAVVATLAMLVMFAGSIVWFWQAFLVRPDILAGNMGPMMTNSIGALAATLLLMAAGASAACLGIYRGYTAQKSM